MHGTFYCTQQTYFMANSSNQTQKMVISHNFVSNSGKPAHLSALPA